MGYKVAEGFSRPDWKAIHEFIRRNVQRDELGSAWNYVAFKWLKELSADYGRTKVGRDDREANDTASFCHGPGFGGAPPRSLEQSEHPAVLGGNFV
jgi:hypothetical protein